MEGETKDVALAPVPAKTRCVEFRIPMPMSLDDYEIGSTYAYLTAAKEEMAQGGGAAGIELLERAEFELDDCEDPRMEAGVVRRKENNFGAHLPTLLQQLAPKDALVVKEWSFDCFPFRRSVFKNAYFGDAFHIEVRQMIIEDDRGDHPDALDLGADYADREVDYIDIWADDKTSSPLEGTTDIKTFRSEKHNLGPLGEDFYKGHEPICTVYAAAFVRLETPVMQGTAEDLLLGWGIRENLLAIHRRMVTEVDAWKDEVELEQLDALEDEVLRRNKE